MRNYPYTTALLRTEALPRPRSAMSSARHPILEPLASFLVGDSPSAAKIRRSILKAIVAGGTALLQEDAESSSKTTAKPVRPLVTPRVIKRTTKRKTSKRTGSAAKPATATKRKKTTSAKRSKS